MKYFSVIVPIYNVENYLEKCIKSIITQNYSDFELILVDDGSTDKSGEICDLYSNRENIRVIHKQNGGISSARNAGIMEAQGEWCVFVDSDDYIGDKNFLSKLHERSINKDVVIYGSSHFIDGTDKVIRLKYTKLEKINNLDNIVDQLKYLNSTNNVSVSAGTHAIRRKFIEDNKLMFDEEIKNCEDVVWFFKIMLSCPRISALDGNQNFYRIRQNSLSREIKEGFWKYRYTAIKLSEKYINESTCDIELKKELLRYLAYQYLILLLDVAISPKSNNNDITIYSQVNELKYLLKYGKGFKNIVCKFIINVFGIKTFSIILSYIKK